MVKYRIFVTNIEKEENWINQQIRQGYRLKAVTAGIGRYLFEKEDAQDGEKCNIHEIKMDFRIFKKEDEFQDYLALFEDSGWRHIAGSKSTGSQYFERMHADAGADIFSDSQSKGERYKRLANMFLELFMIYLPTLMIFWMTGIVDIGKMFHLKELYYTPGLWERTGIDFWSAFLFETPFALGRGGVFGLLFFAIVLAYAYFGLKALYWSKKKK